MNTAWSLTKEQEDYLNELICSRSSMVREHLREPIDAEELQSLKEEEELLDSFGDGDEESPLEQVWNLGYASVNPQEGELDDLDDQDVLTAWNNGRDKAIKHYGD